MLDGLLFYIHPNPFFELKVLVETKSLTCLQILRVTSPRSKDRQADLNQIKYINLTMQVQVDIEFDQLVKLVKQLPTPQWKKLKREVEEKVAVPEKNSELISLLLSAPTYSKKQLNEVAKTRKAINQWRTK